MDFIFDMIDSDKSKKEHKKCKDGKSKDAKHQDDTCKSLYRKSYSVYSLLILSTHTYYIKYMIHVA